MRSWIKKKTKEVCVIGVGRFGGTIIEKLSKSTKFDIIAIDANQNKLKKLSGVTKIFVGDVTDEDFLESLGLDSVDIFVIGIGDNIQSSLLANGIIKRLYPRSRIIAKSVSDEHTKILEKLEADEIINPDLAAAKKAVFKIMSPMEAGLKTDEMIDVDDTVSIIKILVPIIWINQKVKNIKIPRGVSIVLIYRNNKPMIITGETSILKGDRIVVIGENTVIFRLANANKDISKEYSNKMVTDVWNSIPTCKGKVYCEDPWGRLMLRQDYGTSKKYGWNIDHVIPISSGGSRHLKNLQPLHWESNIEKGSEPNYGKWEKK